MKFKTLLGFALALSFSNIAFAAWTQDPREIADRLCPKEKCIKMSGGWGKSCSQLRDPRPGQALIFYPYISIVGGYCPCSPQSYERYERLRYEYNGTGTMRVTLVPEVESHAREAYALHVYESMTLGMPQSEIENQIGVGESESLVREVDGSVTEIKSWSSRGDSFQAEFTNGSLTSKFLNRVFQD